MSNNSVQYNFMQTLHALESMTNGDEDKNKISKKSDRLTSSIEKDMSINRVGCIGQEADDDFSCVVIKHEEIDLSDSEIPNNETDVKPQIFNTVNTNKHSDLIVKIKPEPIEIESRVKQEFVFNQGTGPTDAAIKNEESETSLTDTAFSFEEAKTWNDSNEQDFNCLKANTSVKCDPLATETSIKQENEACVTSFSTFSGSDGDTDVNSGHDRSVAVSGIDSVDKIKNKPSFNCDVCNKTYIRQDRLRNHILKHTQASEKPYQCDVCSKNFSHLCNLNYHKRIHTGEKPYRCDVCNKTFSRSCSLSDHKRIHTGKKPFQCDICDKCFVQSGHLNLHKRLHTGEKPYRCDECGKSFTRSYALNIHKRIHTGEKPNQCDICNKSFTQRHALKIHKRLHSGEKPYQCDVCSKTFSQSQQINEHRRTHTGERPYQCDVCNETFIYSSNLYKHKLKHN